MRLTTEDIDTAEKALDDALAMPYEEAADREERTFRVRLAIRQHLALLATIKE